MIKHIPAALVLALGLSTPTWLCFTNHLTAGLPLSPTGLSCGFRDRHAEGSVTVENRDANLEVGNLAVAVPRQEALIQQFHAMHLRFDAASTVVSTTSSPEGSTKIPGCTRSLVSRHSSSGSGLPEAGALTRWNDSIGTTFRESVAVLPGVVWPIGGDAAHLLIRWHSVLKSGTIQSSPTRRKRLSTTPVVCRSGIPNRTLRVRHV